MKTNLKNIFAAIFITCVLISVGFTFGTTYSRLKSNKIQTISNLIRSNYDGKIDEEVVAENFLKGLGDEYSYYLNKNAYQKLKSEDQGEYIGIGIIYSFNHGLIKTLEVFENTPANTAGVLKGDFITKINNVEVSTLKNSDEAINLFQGKEGEDIKLSIKGKDNKEKSIVLKRTLLQLPSLNLKVLNDNIYYLKIFRFQENTVDEFKQTFTDIQPENLDKLIIDLRNNLGGNIEASLFLDKQFIEKSILLKEIYKNQKEVITRADSVAKYKNTKIVILVNKETSSAAEQMAAAFQDNNRAEVVGESTYGKGVFGNYFELKDGSAIHLTIGHWLRPNGETIQSLGVKPNMEIQDIITENQDDILNQAILRLK